MTVYSRFSAFSILLSLFILIGCSDKGDDPNPVGNNPPPDAPVWTADIRPVFATHCFSCHSGSSPLVPGFEISEYDSVIAHITMNGNPLVVPGEPDSSELVWRLEGSHSLVQMPWNLSPLPEETITVIRTWIDEGAAEE